MTETKKFLRRYTDLPALIYLLRTKRITLLDPETWDDKNDSYFLRLYREKNKFHSVLALCFSQHAETYHHWRVFAAGPSGVCISFKREKLLRAIREVSGIRQREVKYIKLTDTRRIKPAISQLPFLKRFPFEPENEFRIVLGSRKKLTSLDIPIALSCIDKIVLSPWLHSSLSDQIKRTLWDIEDCSQLRINRSTLISNDEWRTFGETASAIPRRSRRRRASATRN
jgi:hypothetical protein